MICIFSNKGYCFQGATSGTVCGDNFNNASAAVICKQMGHQYAVDWSTRDHKGIQVLSNLEKIDVTPQNMAIYFIEYNSDQPRQFRIAVVEPRRGLHVTNDFTKFGNFPSDDVSLHHEQRDV